MIIQMLKIYFITKNYLKKYTTYIKMKKHQKIKEILQYFLWLIFQREFPIIIT